MSKFSGAVRAGMNAADVAKLNRIKIRETLNSLAEAVEAATDGKVTVRVFTGSSAIAEDALKAFTSFVLAKKIYDALILEEKKGTPKRKIQIARFQQSTSGFPCTVAVGADEYICHDNESLENVLAKIMQSTAVGLSISELQSSVATTVAQGRISMPTGRQDERTIEGQVQLRTLPGKIADKPFGGKTIREVSDGAVNITARSSMRAAPTVIKANKSAAGELRPRASANSKAKKVVEKEAEAKVTGRKINAIPAAKKSTVKESTKPTAVKPAVKKSTRPSSVQASPTPPTSKRTPTKARIKSIG